MSATEYLAAIAEATKAMPDATKQPDREKLQGAIQASALALAGHCMDAQFWVMKTQEELVVTTKTLGAAQALIAKYHGEQAKESAAPAEAPNDDSDAHRRQLALGKLLDEIIEYTCKRIAHLPALEGEARQMTVETLVASETTFQNLGKLLSLAGIETSQRWIISDHVDRLGAALESTEEPT